MQILWIQNGGCNVGGINPNQPPEMSWNSYLRRFLQHFKVHFVDGYGLPKGPETCTALRCLIDNRCIVWHVYNIMYKYRYIYIYIHTKCPYFDAIRTYILTYEYEYIHTNIHMLYIVYCLKYSLLYCFTVYCSKCFKTYKYVKLPSGHLTEPKIDGRKLPLSRLRWDICSRSLKANTKSILLCK